MGEHSPVGEMLELKVHGDFVWRLLIIERHLFGDSSALVALRRSAGATG